MLAQGQVACPAHRGTNKKRVPPGTVLLSEEEKQEAIRALELRRKECEEALVQGPALNSCPLGCVLVQWRFFSPGGGKQISPRFRIKTENSKKTHLLFSNSQTIFLKVG